jgi:ABC-type Fe3+/spermidine/putrescine transport system ATPase subunit
VPTLRLTGLRRQFGSAVVLDGVDLVVESGTLCCLLGPSGSGKTTLLKLLAGQQESQAGTMLLDNRDITFTPAAARGFGFVPQNYALFPHLTVLENAAFSLDAEKLSAAEIKTRALEALRLVGADGWADRRPQELSGGQQQRVALARAGAPSVFPAARRAPEQSRRCLAPRGPRRHPQTRTCDRRDGALRVARPEGRLCDG